MTTMDPEFAQKIPKIELHLHLDGSLSPEFIAEEAKENGIKLPVENAKDLRKWLQEQKSQAIFKNGNKVGQGQNWSIFDFCNQFLQTRSQLEKATIDICRRLYLENVVYAEIRFCPTLHTSLGLSAEEALQAVVAGFRKQKVVQGGIIVCALRSKDAEHSIEMAELAGKYLQINKSNPIGVVGYDVAGDEGSFPLNSLSNPMSKGLLRAKELNVPITVHAGEWPEKFKTLENLKFALNHFNVNRIGHGITLRSDLDYLKTLSKQNVTIEVCLTSNIGYGFKVKSYAQHPVKLFHQFSIPFSFCMDNWFLSGDMEHQPGPNHELIRAFDLIGKDGIKKAMKNGARAAFSPVVDAAWINAYDQKIDSIFSI